MTKEQLHDHISLLSFDWGLTGGNRGNISACACDEGPRVFSAGSSFARLAPARDGGVDMSGTQIERDRPIQELSLPQTSCGICSGHLPWRLTKTQISHGVTEFNVERGA